MELIEKIEKINKIVNENGDILNSFISTLDLGEYLEAESVKKELKAISTEDRLLRVGIIGRVKAGKSSLLNALLFEGKNVLPKAATPMTAALTILSYGEMAAEVEFYSSEDMGKIERKAEEYKNIKSSIVKNKIESIKSEYQKRGKEKTDSDIRVMAEKAATKEMGDKSDLTAAYEQWEQITALGSKIPEIGTKKRISGVNDYNTLVKSLSEYVGSEGKFMPYTKSVQLWLPNEALKEIEIVDTPGLNDPVLSREQRTKELLSLCDVTFILSPAGQFMSEQDTNLLDRISLKEGVQEFYIIASQVDTQLFGSEKESNGGNFSRVVDSITNGLSQQLEEVLRKIVEQNPESRQVLEKLIESSKTNFLHSSGIAYSMLQQWNNQDKWDEGMRHVWENLQFEYPDYFSKNDAKTSHSSLKLLANIEAIREKIEDVRSRKDEIVKEKLSKYLLAKENAVKAFQENVLVFLEEEQNSIENGDQAKIEKEKKELVRIMKNAGFRIDQFYESKVDDLTGEIYDLCKNSVDESYKEVNRGISTESKTESKKYTVDHGMGFLFLRSLTGTRYEEKTETVHYESVRAGGIANSLKAFKSDMNMNLSDIWEKSIKEFKKSLHSQLIGEVRRVVENDELVDGEVMVSAIKTVTSSIMIHDVESDNSLPSHINRTGTLRDSEAEQFVDDAKEYLQKLKSELTIEWKKNTKILEKNLLEHQSIADKIFANFSERLSELEKKIQNKKESIASLERVKRLLLELKNG